MRVFLCKYMAIGCLLVAASLNAQAAPYFSNKEGNMIWDKATGLVWMRCSLGQTWDGKTCIGEPKALSFYTARKEVKLLNSAGGFGGHSDWTVPTIRQLLSLRDCSSGHSENTRDIQDGGASVAEDCRGGSTDPTIDLSVFPGTPGWKYWSSSLDSRDSDVAWYVHFGEGFVNRYAAQVGGGVRLIRANQLSGSEAAPSYSLNLTEKRQAAEQKARAERIAAERKVRDEAERKVRDDRNQAYKQLLALGARGLYVEAGKAQRNGSVTFVNTRFGADELYEMIVDKFADSEYAVKATDQLTAMSRSSREQSSAQSAAQQSDFNARQRAYEACKIEMDSCYSRTNGKGACYRDCDRLR